MNHLQQFLTELVEENSGVVLEESPFEFRGNTLLVGMIQYFGYQTVNETDSIYRIGTTIPGQIPPPITVPVNTVLPVISGQLVVAQQLSVTRGTWE